MSRFAKRHYEVAAEFLTKQPEINRKADIDIFCKLFEEDNPRFNSEKFIEACQNRE